MGSRAADRMENLETSPAGQQSQAAANGLRFRINPENRVTLTLTGKKPGAGWPPEVQKLSFNEHPGVDMRPYDRLIGAALNGERWLFAQQETVEAARRVIDPVVGDVVRCCPTPGQLGLWGPGHRPA